MCEFAVCSFELLLKLTCSPKTSAHPKREVAIIKKLFHASWVIFAIFAYPSPPYSDITTTNWFLTISLIALFLPSHPLIWYCVPTSSVVIAESDGEGERGRKGRTSSFQDTSYTYHVWTRAFVFLIAAHILVDNNLNKSLFQAADVSCFAGRLSQIAKEENCCRVEFSCAKDEFSLLVRLKIRANPGFCSVCGLKTKGFTAL